MLATGFTQRADATPTVRLPSETLHNRGHSAAAALCQQATFRPNTDHELTRLPRTASGTGKDTIMRSIASPEFLYPCDVRGGMIMLISARTVADSPAIVMIASPATTVMISSYSCV